MGPYMGLRMKVSNSIGTSGSGEPELQTTHQPALKDGPKASGTWQATATFHWLVGGHPGVEDDGSCCVLQVIGGDGVAALKEKVRSEEVSEARKGTMRGWGKNFLTVENQQKCLRDESDV